MYRDGIKIRDEQWVGGNDGKFCKMNSSLREWLKNNVNNKEVTERLKPILYGQEYDVFLNDEIPPGRIVFYDKFEDVISIVDFKDLL